MKYETIFRRLHEATKLDIGKPQKQLALCREASEKMTWKSSENEKLRRAFRVQMSEEVIAGRFIRVEFQHQQSKRPTTILTRAKWSPWQTRAVGYIDLSGKQEPIFIFRCKDLSGGLVIQENLGTSQVVPEISTAVRELQSNWLVDWLVD